MLDCDGVGESHRGSSSRVILDSKIALRTVLYLCIKYRIQVNMYHVSAQGVDEHVINVHYYYYGAPVRLGERMLDCGDVGRYRHGHDTGWRYGAPTFFSTLPSLYEALTALT